MDNYYITTNDSSLGYETCYYWNRRKKRFQSYLTIACIYPTLIGVRRVFYNMNIDNVSFHSIKESQHD